MRSSIIDIASVREGAEARESWLQLINSFVELTKPRVNVMVLLTTAAGFYLASRAPYDLVLLFNVLVGTGLLATGTAVLNQYMEREADGRMHRTLARPLPSGRVTSRQALNFGMLLVSAGTVYLLGTTNTLTALLGWLTSVIYLLVYTPLKTRSTWCTLIGAIPGALPPVMGWTAQRGSLGIEAAILFGILFCWQFPHFLAISWLYRDDYERGGFYMLPQGEEAGPWAGRRILSFAIVLLPVSMAPYWSGLTGPLYLAGAIVMGLFFLWSSYRTARLATKPAARLLLRNSVIYLPVLLLFLAIGKV
jgi:protoheme IX farnesyltransferase